MKTTDARFPFGGRVKLILMMTAVIFAVFIMPPFYAHAQPEEAEEGETQTAVPSHGYTNLIRTSNSTDNYSLIECTGDTITAKGKYTFDAVTKMGISRLDETSATYKFSSHKDGSYEAQLTVKPESDGEYRLVFLTKAGASMSYLIMYESGRGWYFPVNGLEAANRKVFEHIFEAPAEASALYISSSEDPAEISSALEQLSVLTQKVTEGLEDDYEKARAISVFIAKTYYYDFEARETDADLDTIALCNVLRTSKTVCGGFANLFGAMAEAAGLDAVNIKGGVVARTGENPITYADLGKGVQNHEWAAFRYEKEDRWVWVDACWDGSGSYNNGEFTESIPKVMYFDISDEALSFNHRADKAERRHYFSSMPETQPLSETTRQADEPSEITSEADADAETTTVSSAGETASDGSEEAPVSSSAAVPEESAAVTSSQTEPDTAAQTTVQTGDSRDVLRYPKGDMGQSIYYAVIAVLICAVVAVTVILIKILKNGRKK